MNVTNAQVGVWGVLSALALLAGPGTSKADEMFHLAGDPNTPCTIVISPSASKAEAFAAQELQRYVHKMTTQKLPLVEAAVSESISQRSILIGGAADAFLMPQEKARVAGASNDSYLLAVKGSRLLIRGNRPGMTLFGVYQLLRKFGCRWISPLPWGEFIPEKKELAVSLSLNEFRETPFPVRGLHISTDCEPREETLLRRRVIAFIDWMSKQGASNMAWSSHGTGLNHYLLPPHHKAFKEAITKRDLPLTMATHSWGFLLPKELYQEHPEYKAIVGPKGDRRPNTLKPCTSHPEVVRIVAENVKKLLRQAPELTVVGLGSTDGMGWCECERCKAQDDPDDPQNMARRRQIFVNQVIEEVSREFPNATFKIEGSYGGVRGPARDVEIPENVHIVTAHMHGGCYRHLQDWRDCKYKSHRVKTKTVLDWAEAAHGNVLFHGYCVKTGMLGTWWPICKAMKEQLQWMKSENLMGIESQCATSAWWSMGLNSYAFMRLNWDVDASVEAIIKDYCAACFGKQAGPPMAQYYLVLENALQTYDADPMNYASGISTMLFRDDNGILESMDQYLQQAEEKADTDAVKERLKKVRTHYEYTLQFKQVFRCDLKDVLDEAQKLKDLLPTLKGKDIATHYEGVQGHLSRDGGGTDYTGLARRYQQWLKTQETTNP